MRNVFSNIVVQQPEVYLINKNQKAVHRWIDLYHAGNNFIDCEIS